MLNTFLKFMTKITPVSYRWLWEHDGFKRYFFNTGWMFAGQVFALLLSFFIGAWMARYLGPEDYGTINYALAFAGLFGFIASFGVDSILVRELVKTPEKKEELLGTSFTLKLLGALIAIIITIIATFVVKQSSFNRILIIIFTTSFIFQSVNVVSAFFQSRVEAKNNVWAQVIAGMVSSVLKIIFILSGADLWWLILIFTLDACWQSLLLVLIYRRRGHRLSAWRLSWSLARQIVSTSWLLMLSAAVSFILLRIDQVMIGQILGTVEVGLYAVAVKFVEVWYFLPAIISASLFPAILNAKKTDINIYQRRLSHFFVFMLIFALFVALGTVALSYYLVVGLFGAEYLPAVAVLRVYAWSSLGLFLNWAFYQQLIAENRLSLIFFSNFAGMILNVCLNFLFINRFAIIGAAWATLISYLLVPAIMFGYFRLTKKPLVNES
jgi:O-antigen/teichoic acid export membrane protein